MGIIFIFVALYNWRKERKEKLIKILNEQTILLILNKQAILKIDKYRSSNFYESIKKHLRDVSDFINSIRLNLWKEVHTCITILIPRSLSRGKKIRVRRRTKSQGVRAKIKEAQDDARIPWWPWKQKEASSFVSRGHTLVCRGIIRLWLDIISIETSIEASRENKTALLRPLMARWFSESGRRVLDVPLTRQFRCPTICQIASRLEGELSLSFFPPVAFICIGIYRKKGEEKGQIERTPPFPRCHFCAVCNSETRRFYLTRFPRWIFVVCVYSLVRVVLPLPLSPV